MIASDCVIAWGEVNIILSACMKENATAVYVSIEVLMSSIEVLTVWLLGRAVIFLGLL